MIEMDKSSQGSRRTSIWGVACGRFLSLGGDETGAALVTTLAMFMFIYVVCMGVYAVSTAVRERIHLQNAVDAAAYSAAVVQADTLSRIATINRAMAWTYVQMTRRQMDYIVLRWLQHTVDHYNQDSAAADAYNKGGILGPPCGGHGSEGTETWFIGANTSGSSMNKVQLNGWNPSNYLGVDLSVPGFSDISGLIGIGTTTHITNVEAAVSNYAKMTGFKNLMEGITGDGVIADGIGGLSAFKDFVYDVSASEPSSNWETYQSIKSMYDGYNGTVSNKYEGAGTAVEQLLQVQIALDRLNIAMMNICERRLAVELPGKIATAVQNIVRANVPEYMADDCFYYLEQNANPVVDESNLPEVVSSGYFCNLYNSPHDEKRFLRFAGYCYDDRSLIDEFMLGGNSENLSGIEELEKEALSRVAAGLDQWFVRGNGNRRTDGARGLQRCYKHWAEGPFSNIHATHNPFPPSCWNTDENYLHNSPPSIALYSEWVWWSDVWSCPKFLWFQLHIHLCPHASKIWPWKMECDHNSEPGMFGANDLSKALKAIGDLPGAVDDIEELVSGVFEGRGQEGDEGYVAPAEDNLTEDEQAALDNLDNLGDSYGKSFKEQVSGNEFDSSKVDPTDIDSYEDGCLMVPFLGTGSAAGHVAGYSRLYADAPQLYNSCYVGERAKPLVLRKNYFGKAGTITVGIVRRNENVWKRILGMVEGALTAFNPSVAWTWAFSSAKAGYMDKGDSLSDRRYRVDWQAGNQEWNLCQSDWDAVFVPVRHAHSQAEEGEWAESTNSVYSVWTSNVAGWKPVNDDSTSEIGDGVWSDVYAPPWMLTVGGKKGSLDWGGLSDVSYH